MRAIKKAIILCWIMLVACFAIKLFGGNWFEVVCTNEHFILVCDFIQNNKIAFFVSSFIIYTVPMSFTMLSVSMMPIPKKRELFICIFNVLLVWFSVLVSLNLKTILEIANFIITPIILNYSKEKEKGILYFIKNKWYYGIVGLIIIFFFQFVSLITRNIGIKVTSDNVLITFILLIDYYILLFLYYLYIRIMKGEKR